MKRVFFLILILLLLLTLALNAQGQEVLIFNLTQLHLLSAASLALIFPRRIMRMLLINFFFLLALLALTGYYNDPDTKWRMYELLLAYRAHFYLVSLLPSVILISNYLLRLNPLSAKSVLIANYFFAAFIMNSFYLRHFPRLVIMLIILNLLIVLLKGNWPFNNSVSGPKRALKGLKPPLISEVKL